MPGYRRVAALSVSLVALLAIVPASAAASSGKQRFGKQTLMLGMRSTSVMTLQRDLNATGFKVLQSGAFTRATVREVREFQARYRLQVDGVVGPATWKKLEHLLNSVNHITEAAPTGTGASGVSTTDLNADASDNSVQPGTDGGIGLAPAPQNVPVADATLIDGLAVPAPGTPQTIVELIDAANSIAFLPYIYGGGHKAYAVQNGVTALEAGYDCSGSVSFALHAGNLLAEPLDSEQFAGYGLKGDGKWITIWDAPTFHTYMEVAGLWFDTAAQSAANGDDRWSPTRIREPGSTFTATHPAGW